jgi:hypothetical protein
MTRLCINTWREILSELALLAGDSNSYAIPEGLFRRPE